MYRLYNGGSSANRYTNTLHDGSRIPNDPSRTFVLFDRDFDNNAVADFSIGFNRYVSSQSANGRPNLLWDSLINSQSPIMPTNAV